MKRNSFTIPEDNTPGVYAIINTSKKICYIGQAKTRRERCKNHLNSLKAGTHQNKLMQSHFDAGDKFIIVYLYDSKEKLVNDERLMAESYFYCCLNAAGVKMYNTDSIKYLDNFFMRAKRLDPATRRLFEAIRTGK